MNSNFGFSFYTPKKWETAKCINISDPDFFHPISSEEHQIAAPIIKEFCETCPVRIECLEFALEMKEFEGYYGGISGKERRKMSANGNRVKRGNSLEVHRLVQLGWDPKEACEEVAVEWPTFLRWRAKQRAKLKGQTKDNS